MSATITGDREVAAKLAALSRESASVARAGLVKFTQVVAKGIKQQLPSRYRTAIGSSVKTSGQYPKAKAGAGVGKQGKRKARKAGRAGVGISKANIHWMLLGVWNRRTKSGLSRGSWAGNHQQAVKRGYYASRREAMRAMAEAAKKQIARKAKGRRM